MCECVLQIFKYGWCEPFAAADFSYKSAQRRKKLFQLVLRRPSAKMIRYKFVVLLVVSWLCNFTDFFVLANLLFIIWVACELFDFIVCVEDYNRSCRSEGLFSDYSIPAKGIQFVEKCRRNGLMLWITLKIDQWPWIFCDNQNYCMEAEWINIYICIYCNWLSASTHTCWNWRLIEDVIELVGGNSNYWIFSFVNFAAPTSSSKFKKCET